MAGQLTRVRGGHPSRLLHARDRPGQWDYPQREELQPVRLVLSGPSQTMSVLEGNPEIRGRVRQALDSALGPTVYLTQMGLSISAGALAA